MDHRVPPLDLDYWLWDDPDIPIHVLWGWEGDSISVPLSAEERAEGAAAARHLLDAVVALGRWLWRSL